jgi:hypothetical protein
MLEISSPCPFFPGNGAKGGEGFFVIVCYYLAAKCYYNTGFAGLGRINLREKLLY